MSSRRVRQRPEKPAQKRARLEQEKKEAQAEKRGRRHGGTKRRPINRRPLRPRVLIVCEGTKTEPNYFLCFPVNKKVAEVIIKGTGRNTDTLVEEAKKIRKKDGPFSEVWVVFDRDSFSPHQMNRAIQLADGAKIEVAYTNEAFELWYLLHFDDIIAAHSRTKYKGMLSTRLGETYEKKSPKMYGKLLSRQPEAIRRAKALNANYKPLRPEQDNPSTTVHKLVERLNELAP